MEIEKWIIGFVIFNSVLALLPLVGVSNLVTHQSSDVFGNNTLVNEDTGIMTTDLWGYLAGILVTFLGTAFFTTIGASLVGLSLSGGMLIKFAIFAGVFVSLGVNTLRVIQNVLNTVSSGFPTAQPIITGIFVLFCLVYALLIILMMSRIAAGGVE